MSSWDNTKHVIQWVDDTEQTNNQSEAPTASDPAAMTTTRQRNARKRKVVTVETEPSHTAIAGSSINVDLFVSVNCNYAKVKCSTDRIYFKDTFMLETRLYRYSPLRRRVRTNNNLLRYLSVCSPSQRIFSNLFSHFFNAFELKSLMEKEPPFLK